MALPRHLVATALAAVPFANAAPAQAAPPDGQAQIEARLGLRFSILGSKIRRRIISTDTPWGFAVRTVRAGSLAAKAGLEPGAIVMRVDGTPFREVEELRAVLRKKQPGARIVLSCTRRKKQRRPFDRKPWEDFVVELRLPTASPKPGASSRRRRSRWF